MSISSWSEPAEQLLQAEGRCDVLVIGSGYGGSVAAATLADGARTVWVLERGREYALGEFPRDVGELPGHVRLQRAGEREAIGRKDALFDVRSFEGGAVLVGSGLGGGSLINAGVALRPDYAVFRRPPWPEAVRKMTDEELDALFADAQGLLGAEPLPDAEQLPKFQALARLARAVGGKAEAVPLTIAADDLPAGDDRPVDLQRCVRCGNCFTGCNFGAKRTLATNLIPRAVQNKARFFTGAEALRIEAPAASGGPYRVAVRLVADRMPAEHVIEAGTVIVSAGSLGSTEILMRSLQAGKLALPPQALGSRFSGNGDTIAMGWGQRTPVQAFAATRADGAPLPVGPTISGVIRTRVDVGGAQRTAFIQDGAAPQALAAAGAALGSTLSLFHRYTRWRLPAFFRGRADWVAAPAALRDHAQLLLGMGEDEANGWLGWDGERLCIERWPDSPGGAGFQEALHERLRQAGRSGFDGGDYLPNPMWRPLPDLFAQVVGTDAQVGNRLSVHPLGGCPMGDDPGQSVVDDLGAVRRAGGGVYEGLHVLDGAILPAATGANPFLTIAALSLRAARAIAARLPVQAGGSRPIPQQQPRVRAASVPAPGAEDVQLAFRETLVGAHGGGSLPDWLQQLLSLQGVPDGALRSWAAVVEVDIDLQAWLADPARALPAKVRLWGRKDRVGPTVDPALFDTPPLLCGTGQVRLLASEAPRWYQLPGRMAAAWCTFLQRRPGETQFKLSCAGVVAALATARNHAVHRVLSYDFRVESPQAPGEVLVLAGSKKLAYARGERNLWEALIRLPLELRKGTQAHAFTLDVDLVDMVRNSRLQVQQAAHTPAVIVGLASFAALWVRALVQTHFWSFRGLDYGRLKPVAPPPMPRWPQSDCKAFPFRVPTSRQEPREIELQLHRYTPAGGGNGRGILLVHGLAHGSGVFTTETLRPRRNMAQALLQAGYTVWLLDHRLSNRLGFAAMRHAIDDVARFDIAQALALVYRENGGQPFAVFAHCVGAAAFAMAVLDGKAKDERGRDMVSQAILHAVHPWVVPSTSNRFSAALAALYKDALPDGLEIAPVPPRFGTALDQVIDRVAATLPWSEAESAGHLSHRSHDGTGYAVCNRMTLFYGQEWLHGNLDERTHAQLSGLVGTAGIEVFRQLFFMALRGRLTDRDGENSYLTQPRVDANWNFPTLFAHGSDNRVFDVRSAVQAWKRMRWAQLGRGSGVPQEVRLFVPEGRCGHMDFLFGIEAERTVYPKLLEYLRAPEAFRSSVQGRVVREKEDEDILVNVGAADEQDVTDRATGIVRPPLCGPAVQVELRGGVRRLLVWCEQAVDATSDPVTPRVRIGDHELQAGDYTATASEASGAGICWLLEIPEAPQRPFAEARSIEIKLRYDGAVPMIRNLPRQVRQQVSRLKGLGFYQKKVEVTPAARPLLKTLPQQAPAPAPAFPREEPRQDGKQESDEEEGWLPVPVTGLPWWQRWTQPRGDGPRATCFLAASCRWPGLAFERDAVQQLAQQMLGFIEGDPERAAQGLVLLGDQIYVDATANVTETTARGERGPQRYREAWAPETASGTLLAHLPCWMVVDDHEFGDNVSEFEGPLHDDGIALTKGFEATVAFQWRTRQATPLRWPPHPLPPPAGPASRGFWYAFEIGGIPAFAADTRTERHSRADAVHWAQAPIMGAEQAAALEAWLLAHPDVPKVLCSGSVFGLPTRRSVEHPLTRRREDDWTGYPASLERLVAFIVRNEVRNVIFLSGDYHLSAMARLTLAHEGKSVPALAIACSGWNASLPFANARAHEFDWEQDVVVQAGAAQVTSHAWLLSDAGRQFARVCILREPAGGYSVEAAVFDDAGKCLRTQALPLA